MATTENSALKQGVHPAEEDQSPLESALVATIETRIADMMRDRQLPGFAIGIVKDGTLAYAQGFGVASVGSQKPVTPTSIFLMGSMSKAFTATAIMQLVEAGQIRLDAPVTDYLPYFQLADARYHDILIHHLLTHTSGLGFWPPYDFENVLGYWNTTAPTFDDAALERYVRGLRDLTLPFAPGHGYAYSDAGYNVLGDVIAKVSGQPFEDYIQEHILTPLGMQNSTFLLREVDQDLLVRPHHLDERSVPIESHIFPYTRSQAPCGYLFSNVEDMARWAMVNLNRGVLQGTRILAEASYAALWAAQVAPTLIDPSGAVTHAYGFGWDIDHLGAHPIVRHAGGDLGYQSFILLAPDDATAVVTMGNRLDTFTEPFYAVDIGTTVVKLLLGDEHDGGERG